MNTRPLTQITLATLLLPLPLRSQIVSIADPALESAVRYELNVYNRPLAQTDIQQLLALNANQNNISSLEGFSSATQLIELFLSFNHIASATLAPDFFNLQELHLQANGLESLHTTAPLPNLLTLNIAENLLTNVEFLAHTPILSSLQLQANALPDFVPPAPLTNLQFLNLSFNLIQQPDFITQLPALQPHRPQPVHQPTSRHQLPPIPPQPPGTRPLSQPRQNIHPPH